MNHLTDELLDAVADGETLDEAAALHLRTCAECQANVAQRIALRARLAALPQAVPTSGDLWPSVEGVIQWRRRRRLLFTSAPALALAATLLIAVVRLNNGPDVVLPSSSAELAELKAIVPPVVVDAMAANLTIYDAALHELETYASSAKDDSDVQQRIEELRRKRAALLRLASNS